MGANLTRLKVLKKPFERMDSIWKDGRTFSSPCWKITLPKLLPFKKVSSNLRVTSTKSEKTSLVSATKLMLLILTVMTKLRAWLFPNANSELLVELPAPKLPPTPWTLTNKEKPPLTWNLAFISSNRPGILMPLPPFANLTTKVLVVSPVTSTVVSELLSVMMMPNVNQPTTTWAMTISKKSPRMPGPSRFNTLMDSTNGTQSLSGAIN